MPGGGVTALWDKCSGAFWRAENTCPGGGQCPDTGIPA